MSLYLYTIFETVAACGSFFKASEMLNLTPSAVSHAIAKLETDMGFKLFIRNRKGVQITGEGETILPLIRALHQDHENLQQLISKIHHQERGIIRLGVFTSITLTWLSDIVKSFRKKYPGIEIRVSQGSYTQIVHWINSNSVDIAFIADTVLPPSMPRIRLHRDPIVCAVPDGFIHQHPNYIIADDLKNTSLVMPAVDYDQEAAKIIKKYNLVINSYFYIDTDDAMMVMVKAGFGPCIITDLIYKSCRIYDVNYYPFYPEEHRIISLVCPNPSIAANLLKEEIIRYVKQRGLYNI